MFGKTMCAMCRTATSAPAVRAGGLCVCAECFGALPKTGRTMSFAALKPMEFIVSPFYYMGPVRTALLEYKFNGSRGYAEILAALMRDALAGTEAFKGFDMMVPVPLSKERLRERGYNQAALMAEKAAGFLGVDYRDDVLRRVRNTRRQSGLQNHERIANVKGAFAASADVSGRSIIVFDDIYTTGFTLEECAAALKSAGAERIAGMTFAAAYKKHINPEARIF